jgi:hypothetical protein
VTVRVQARSKPATRDDELKRELAWDLMKGSNEAVIAFAKLMVPTALSAVGAVIALAEYVGAEPVLIAIACVLMLCAALLFGHAAYARLLRVSLDDYDDVASELLVVARARHRETTAGLGVLAVAVLVAIAALVT